MSQGYFSYDDIDGIGSCLSTSPITLNKANAVVNPTNTVIYYKGLEFQDEDIPYLKECLNKKYNKNKKKERPKERIVYDGDYTIYYNEKGKKTVVKIMPNEEFDEEKAAMFAILKSMGIKPKHIATLIKNSVDRKAIREKKKLIKKQKALEKD